MRSLLPFSCGKKHLLRRIALPVEWTIEIDFSVVSESLRVFIYLMYCWKHDLWFILFNLIFFQKLFRPYDFGCSIHVHLAHGIWLRNLQIAIGQNSSRWQNKFYKSQSIEDLLQLSCRDHCYNQPRRFFFIFEATPHPYKGRMQSNKLKLIAISK